MSTIRNHSSHRAPFLLAVLGALALASTAAVAQEDREIDSMGHSIFLEGQTAAQLDALDKSTWRITNLEVQSTAPLLFRAILVRNDFQGFTRTWHFYTGQTSFEMLGKTLLHQARLTELEPYVENGEIRYAGVMVNNQGANQKPVFAQFSTNPALLQQHLSNDQARIYDLDSVVLDGVRYYSALTIRNTGADARTWSWALGQSAAQIETMVQQGMRVVDIERLGASNYDVVVQQRGGVPDWRYYAKTRAEVDALLAQNAARLIDAEAYALNGGTVFDVVMVNRGNPVEERVGAMMRAQTDGWVGSAVRGVTTRLTYAELNGHRAFDPGTSLAVLLHAHAMRQVATGGSTLIQNVQYYLGSTGQTCPSNTNLTVATLGAVLVNAVRGSYPEIKAVANLYGHAAIGATAAALDMNETAIAGYVGCTANRSTLVDFADMFDRIEIGYLLNSRDDFYLVFAKEFYGTGYAQGRLRGIIDQAAAQVGLDSMQSAAFVGEVRVYGVSNGQQTATGHQRSHVAVIELPYYGNGGITPRRYTCGAFVADASSATGAGEAAVIGATEPMRELIQEAMLRWRNHVPGGRLSYGTGCGGTLGIPAQQGHGVPEIGETVNYVVSGARPQAPFVMFVGSSRTSYLGVPLPLNLGAFGAPNCALATDLGVTLHGVIGGGGWSSRTFTLPLRSTLIGGRFFTQFAVLDATANALGLAMTPGLETRVGGQR